MKSIYLHVIYLSIIAFLGYNYWSSVQAFKAFEYLDKQLNLDYEVMNNAASSIFDDISKNAKAYPNFENLRNNKQSEMAMNASLNFKDFIANNKAKLISNQYFTDAEIDEIKERISRFSSILIDSITYKDKEDIFKYYGLPKLIADNAYWESIKTLPKNAAIAKLSLIRNVSKIDEITFLNYEKDKTGSNYCGITTWYKTAIAPKKSALLEGETFEADIYLATYSLQNNGNIVIKVNGKPLEIYQGIAHFKSKNQTIGTKTIRAEAIIRNPLTGQTTTSEGSFEYQVLPKCSMNCQ